MSRRRPTLPMPRFRPTHQTCLGNRIPLSQAMFRIARDDNRGHDRAPMAGRSVRRLVGPRCGEPDAYARSPTGSIADLNGSVMCGNYFRDDRKS
jgi:hypothetical protein